MLIACKIVFFFSPCFGAIVRAGGGIFSLRKHSEVAHLLTFFSSLTVNSSVQLHCLQLVDCMCFLLWPFAKYQLS